MKHWNSKKHKEGTGIYNELILSNMTYAVKVGKKVLPRIPVIPGFNDSLEDAIQFAATLRNIGITTCQLLPFHQFGENKYDLLGKHYPEEQRPVLPVRSSPLLLPATLLQDILQCIFDSHYSFF